MNKKSNKAPKPTKMYNLEWWVDGKMREYAIDNGSPVINKTYPICNHLKQKLAGNYTHGLLMIKAVETK